jgi:hypothetical protein
MPTPGPARMNVMAVALAATLGLRRAPTARRVRKELQSVRMELNPTQSGCAFPIRGRKVGFPEKWLSRRLAGFTWAKNARLADVVRRRVPEFGIWEASGRSNSRSPPSYPLSRALRFSSTRQSARARVFVGGIGAGEYGQGG